MGKRDHGFKSWIGTVTATSAKGDEPEITISTSSLDREGDRVIPEGGDVSNFLKNPVLSWAHSRDAIPVGTITHLELGPQSRIRWRWLKNDPFADRVRNAFEQDIIRASSIEFLPKPDGKRANADGGFDYTAWELLGVSLVPLPANAEAVRAFKSLGLLVDVPAYRKWFDGLANPEGTSQGDTRTQVQRDFDIMMGVRRVLIQRAQNWPAHGEAMPWPAPRNLDVVLPECRSFQPLGPARVHGVNLIPGDTIEISDWPGRATHHRSPSKAGERSFEVESADVTEVMRGIVREFVRGLKPKIDAEVTRAVNRARGRID